MGDTSAKGVGNRIARRRVKLGLSQNDLSETLKVPQQTIGGWETGKAKRPSKLLELAKALCTTQEWLLEEEGPEEVVPTISKALIASVVESLDPVHMPAALAFLRNLKVPDVKPPATAKKTARR